MQRDVFMILEVDDGRDGSSRRLGPKDMSQRRYHEKDEEYKEENPGYLGGSAGDASEPEDSGDDCHYKED